VSILEFLLLLIIASVLLIFGRGTDGHFLNLLVSGGFATMHPKNELTVNVVEAAPLEDFSPEVSTCTVYTFTFRMLMVVPASSLFVPI